MLVSVSSDAVPSSKWELRVLKLSIEQTSKVNKMLIRWKSFKHILPLFRRFPLNSSSCPGHHLGRWRIEIQVHRDGSAQHIQRCRRPTHFWSVSLDTYPKPVIWTRQMFHPQAYISAHKTLLGPPVIIGHTLERHIPASSPPWDSRVDKGLDIADRSIYGVCGACVSALVLSASGPVAR